MIYKNLKENYNKILDRLKDKFNTQNLDFYTLIKGFREYFIETKERPYSNKIALKYVFDIFKNNVKENNVNSLDDNLYKKLINKINDFIKIFEKNK